MKLNLKSTNVKTVDELITKFETSKQADLFTNYYLLANVFSLFSTKFLDDIEILHPDTNKLGISVIFINQNHKLNLTIDCVSAVKLVEEDNQSVSESLLNVTAKISSQSTGQLLGEESTKLPISTDYLPGEIKDALTHSKLKTAIKKCVELAKPNA